MEEYCHLVKLQGSGCNFTKSITPPWVIFKLFKLFNTKSYKASQMIN